jgi:threonine dehydrogenase-like Zn-dependent dehydrogenase
MWLKGRVCLNCGSELICWRYAEPHCYCCGKNVPYEVAEVGDMDRNGIIGDRVVSVHLDNEGEGVSVETDMVLLMAQMLHYDGKGK